MAFRTIAELKFHHLVLEWELAWVRDHVDQNAKIAFLLVREGGEIRVLLERIRTSSSDMVLFLNTVCFLSLVRLRCYKDTELPKGI